MHVHRWVVGDHGRKDTSILRQSGERKPKTGGGGGGGGGATSFVRVPPNKCKKLVVPVAPVGKKVSVSPGPDSAISLTHRTHPGCWYR